MKGTTLLLILSVFAIKTGAQTLQSVTDNGNTTTNSLLINPIFQAGSRIKMGGAGSGYFDIYNNANNSISMALKRSDGASVFELDGHVMKSSFGGSLGVGTTMPEATLHVAGHVKLAGHYDGTNNVQFSPAGGAGATWELYPQTNGFGVFNRSNNFWPVFITNDNNTGIGTLTPTEKLSVAGNISWDGYNSGNPRALKIGHSGGNYGGIAYNIDYTGSTGVFNRPLNDYSSYLEFFLGGFKFFGTNSSTAATGINMSGTGENLKFLAILTKEGNMGIGTSTPEQKFVVSDNGADGLEVFVTQPVGVVGLQSYNRATSSYSKMNFDASNFAFGIGNVGIGTADTKGYKLAVNGKIRSQEIKVEAANWPDYVFAKSYQLPTLQETEKHIKEKGHLPGIPSAAEVNSNGIDLGEMNAKLLQKIEELTLHLIEQRKTIKHLDEQRTNQEVLNQANKTTSELQQKQIDELKEQLRKITNK